MAHKKGLGSSKNGRDSNPKYLGVKMFSGQTVEPDVLIALVEDAKDLDDIELDRAVINHMDRLFDRRPWLAGVPDMQAADAALQIAAHVAIEWPRRLRRHARAPVSPGSTRSARSRAGRDNRGRATG